MPPSDNPLVFTLEESFPDACTLFGAEPRSLESIKDEALIVLDTNVLLLPYATGPKTVKDIRELYDRLIADSRLFIPERVAREFARLRGKKLEELYQQLTRRKSTLPSIKSGRHPLLEPFDKYNELLALETKVEEQLSDYRKALDQVIDHVRSWNWNDPVSELYRTLFKPEMLIKPAESSDEIRLDLQRRFEHRIPPGYKDNSKVDDGVGDLLIWLSILNLGKTTGKDIIFVTGEEKPDWWHRSEGQGLYPRFELMEEYWRVSSGRTLQVTKFSSLLTLLGTNKTAIGEVREQESEQRLEQQIEASPLAETSSTRGADPAPEELSGAVKRWLRRRFGGGPVRVSSSKTPSIRFTDGDGDPLCMDIIWVGRRKLSEWLPELLSSAERGYLEMQMGKALFYALIVVASADHRANQVADALQSREHRLPPIHMHIGVYRHGVFFETREIRF